MCQALQKALEIQEQIRQTFPVFTEYRVQQMFVGSIFYFLYSSQYLFLIFKLYQVIQVGIGFFYLELLFLNFLWIQMKTRELTYLYNSNKNTGHNMTLKLMSTSKNHPKDKQETLSLYEDLILYCDVCKRSTTVLPTLDNNGLISIRSTVLSCITLLLPVIIDVGLNIILNKL